MNYKGNDKYGALPRRTVIANQPHMLAYINPQEEMLLRQLGGTGQAGPMGVPAYPPDDGGFSPDGGGGYGGGGGFGGFGGSEGPGGYEGPSAAEIANAFAIAEAAVANASVDVDSGMGAAIGSTGGLNDTSFTGTDGASANVTGTDFDSGAGSVDGVSDVGVSDLGVSTETIGGNIGLSGEEFDDIGLVNTTGSGGVSAGVTGTDFDFGAGSGTGINVGVGTSAGENDVIDYSDTLDLYDDVTDFNTGSTVNPDDIEGGEPDSIISTGFPENPEEGPPDDFEPPVNEPEPEIDPAEYFNLRRSTAPSGWMSNSIWSSTGKGPDFDVDVYQEADGSLRFRETGELIPTEYLKYIDLARRTEMDAPEEEEDIIDEIIPLDDDTVVDTVVEPLDDDTVVEPLDDSTVVETEADPIDMSNYAKYSNNILQMQIGLMDMDLRYDVNGDGVVNTQDATRIQQMFEEGTPFILPSIPSSTAITSQRADGSDMTDMTTIVEGPTDYSMDPDVAESTASTLSGRAQGYYDLVSSGEKGLYEVYEQSLNNRRNRNPMARQAAQDAVDEYLYNNLTPDELRAWQDGQFNPITDPTSSVYNPQGIPEGLL